MKIQGSDVKNLTDVGLGNEARLPNDDKFVVTASSINKTLKQAIIDGDIGGGGVSDITFVSNSADPYAVADTDNQLIKNASGDTAFYDLPASPTPGFEISFTQLAELDGTVGDQMKIRPASGDQIKIGESLVENPGYLVIEGRGITVSLLAVTTSLWVVVGVGGREHRKNGSIGQVKAVGLVGRDTYVTKTNLPATRDLTPASFSPGGYLYLAGGSSDSTTSQYNDVADTWASKASMPAAKNYCATSLNNGFGYAISGSTTNTYEYNDASNSWSTKANYPVTSSQLSGTYLNGYAYSFLGDSANSYRYEGSLNTFTTIAAHPLGTHYEGTSNNLHGYIYNAAGYNISFRSDIYQFNDSAGVWIQKAFMSFSPAARARCFTSNHAGYMTMHSGDTAGPTFHTSSNQYNDSLNTWGSIANLSANRSDGARVGQLNGSGYIAGGRSSGTASTSVLQYN